MTTFKERFRALRLQNGLTQQELADKVGIGKMTVSQYERGVRRPDIDTLELIADFFNVSTDYLLGTSDVTLRFVDSDDLAILSSSAPERSIIEIAKGLDDSGLDRLLQYAEELKKLYAKSEGKK